MIPVALRGVAAWGVALALGGAAQAQSLGDVARKEQERRKRQAPAARSYTDDDLGKRGGSGRGTVTLLGGSPAGAGATPAPAVEAKAGSPSPAPDRRDQELEWRQRFARARQAVADAETRAYRNVVRTEYYQGIPVQMVVREFVETEELRRARAALADLEEELRRSGLPPGWGRE